MVVADMLLNGIYVVVLSLRYLLTCFSLLLCIHLLINYILDYSGFGIQYASGRGGGEQSENSSYGLEWKNCPCL